LSFELWDIEFCLDKGRLISGFICDTIGRRCADPDETPC
jgi:hypothetical protein